MKSGARAESGEVPSGLLCCCDGDLSPAVMVGGPAAIYSWVKLALLGQSKTVLMWLDVPGVP